MTDMTNTTATSTSETTTPAAPATTPAPATPAPEATVTAASETTAPGTLDEATHAAHRQRVDRLLGKNTAPVAASETAPATPAPTPAETAPTTSEALATSDAAPETTTATDAPATDKETAPANATTNKIPATLPSGYCANGSLVDADGIMLPEYIGEYARELAQSLEPLSASSFQRAFLTQAKAVRKKKIPYSEKKNCAQGMIIAAKKLVSRKKDPVPRVLLDMINQATATVEDDGVQRILLRIVVLVGVLYHFV